MLINWAQPDGVRYCVTAVFDDNKWVWVQWSSDVEAKRMINLLSAEKDKPFQRLSETHSQRGAITDGRRQDRKP